MTAVDPSSVNVPRAEWEELLGVVRRSRKCPGVSHDQDCDPSDHDTWISNRARALVDAAERPDEGGRPAGKSQGVASAGEPPTKNDALTAPAPVPVSDEAEAAWREWQTDANNSGFTRSMQRAAFMAGFRVARGEEA